MVKVCISASGCIFLALSCLIVPIPWIMALFIAAFVHEAAHIFAITFSGGNVQNVKLRTYGAEIETGPLSAGQEFICAAAGPAASFLLLIFITFAPRISLCGLFQGLYNILPIYPLDGGRMLRCLLLLQHDETKADKVMKAVEYCFLFVLFTCSVAGLLLLRLGWFPIWLILLFFLKKKTLQTG